MSNWELLVKLRNYREGDIVRVHYLTFHIDIKLKYDNTFLVETEEGNIVVWVSYVPNQETPTRRYGISPNLFYVRARRENNVVSEYCYVRMELLYPVEYLQPKNFRTKYKEKIYEE